MVEQQNTTRQHQRRSKQPVAIPQQALDENSQPVNEDRADSKIADKYAQCQDQAYNAPTSRRIGRGCGFLAVVRLPDLPLVFFVVFFCDVEATIKPSAY